MTRLEYLNLRNSPLEDINYDTFSQLPVNSELHVSQHEICECYIPAGVKCSAANDRSPLSDRVLVAVMWAIGINALVGNLFVLV